MEFRDILKEKIKPELNNIYIEEPRDTPSGIDFGWFCREHALHLFILSKLFGYEANICLGDFLVNVSNEKDISSIGTNADHAWCCINNESPIDISLCLKHIYQKSPDIKSPDISIVFGVSNGNNNKSKILYFINKKDNEMEKLSNSNRDFIAYNEKCKQNFNPIELLEDPFVFLFKPPLGDKKFTEIYGEDVFYQITYHCYKIVTKNIKPFYKYKDCDSSVRSIVKFNPNAKNKIIEILNNN